MTFIVILVLAIGAIVQASRFIIYLKENKQIALENGADKEDYEILQIGLGLYILCYALASVFANIFISVILIILLMPGIVFGIKVRRQLDKGYDYVRKINKNVNQMVWLGYAGIAFIIFNFVLRIIFTQFK